MEHVFFNSVNDLEADAEMFFGVLGTDSFFGDSKNVLGGQYFEVKMLGFLIRLEENSYEYEDNYRYMISVKQDVLGGSCSRKGDEVNLARIVWHLVADNIDPRSAIEVGSSLEVHGPIG